MKWIPIEEKQKDEWGQIDFKSGTQLLYKNKTILLIGDDIQGNRTAGCSCCSVQWVENLDDVTHYRELDLPIDTLTN